MNLRAPVLDVAVSIFVGRMDVIRFNTECHMSETVRQLQHSTSLRSTADSPLLKRLFKRR